jgi:hypothetical protein
MLFFLFVNKVGMMTSPPVKVALSLLSYGRNVDLKAFSWVSINGILLKKQWLL